MSNSSQPPVQGIRKYATIGINLAFLLIAFAGITAFQARNMLDTGSSLAPPLQATTLAGTHFDLAETASQPVLVYFFAPWCNYCAFSADNLTRLRRMRDEQELQIVAVALDWKNVAEVADYADRHQLNVPVLLGGATIARDWKVYGFPTYYVLDSKHRVARRDIGYSTQLGLLWRSTAVD